MDLNGKKIAFLGDSITEGFGTSDERHTYWRIVEQKTGAVCFGYGISGTRIAPNRIPSAEPTHDRHFASRVADMIPDADIVVVFGGTNDYGHGDAALGNMNDRDENSFYGAFHVLCQALIRRYPEALIVVMTPLHRLGDTDRTYNDGGVRLQTDLEGYVNAIQAVAGFYGFPVLDLFRTSGLQPNVPVLQKRFTPDGLHPNDAGHQKIADRLIPFLRMQS